MYIEKIQNRSYISDVVLTPSQTSELRRFATKDPARGRWYVTTKQSELRDFLSHHFPQVMDKRRMKIDKPKFQYAHERAVKRLGDIVAFLLESKDNLFVEAIRSHLENYTQWIVSTGRWDVAEFMARQGLQKQDLMIFLDWLATRVSDSEILFVARKLTSALPAPESQILKDTKEVLAGESLLKNRPSDYRKFVLYLVKELKSQFRPR